MAVVSAATEPRAVRALLVGDSGTGKTGALISLLRAGYTIRMLDMDNNADSLIQLCRHQDPTLLSRLDIMSFRDSFRASISAGIETAGPAKAYIEAIKAMNKWDDGSVPASWDRKTIFVLDSLTMFGWAAYLWAKGQNPTAKDGRQWYAQAGETIKNYLQMITSPAFNPHVLVLSHINLVDMPDGSVKGYASSLGKALGPEIPKVFPTMLQAVVRGSGPNVKRVIQTVPSALLDLKNPIPWALDKELPLDTGLATIFSLLLGEDKGKANAPA